MIPAQGNHEGWPPPRSLYFETLDVEPPAYFEQRMGDLCSFLTLNTEIPTGGDQAAWLDQTLEKSRSARWVYAQYHRPAFAVIKKPSGALQDWVPLFEKHGVDVIYECDGHNFKVLPPIREGAFSTDGVLYFGEGGWGAPQRGKFKDEFWTKEPAIVAAIDHIQLIEIDADTLTINSFGTDGERFHRLVYPHERARRLDAISQQELALPEPAAAP
jgi:hypothetical protein